MLTFAIFALCNQHPQIMEEKAIKPHPEKFYKGLNELLLLLLSQPKEKFTIIQRLRDAPKTVTELYTQANIAQSCASKALGHLKKIGIVQSERHGKNIVYSLNKSRFIRITKIVKSLNRNL